MAKPVGARWESMAAVRDELRYLTPVASAGPRDLISELSTNLSEKEKEEEHKPRNHGTVGRRPGHLTPPAGAQSGPAHRVPPESAVDFADALPEGVVIHEIVDRGVVDSNSANSEATDGLDIQTTSEQWHEIATRSRRIDLIRREVAAREEARSRSKSHEPVSKAPDGFEEILAWTGETPAAEPPVATTPEPDALPLAATSGPGASRSGGADPFVGPDPTRARRRSSKPDSGHRPSAWKIVAPLLLAIALAAAGAWAILRTAGLDLPGNQSEKDAQPPSVEATPNSQTTVPPPTSHPSSRSAARTDASDGQVRAEFAILGFPLEMPVVPLPREPRVASESYEPPQPD
jgi:hypothetical protein